jgi:molybdopterin molybdotransferase
MDGTTRARSVAEHLAAVLALVEPLPVVDLAPHEASGCVLARDLRAPERLPRWDNSAMDGYAVRHADVVGAAPGRPVELAVVADLPAGTGDLPPVAPGTAARIMTGAPVPPGADAVVPVEQTEGGAGATGTVRVLGAPAPGAHIRRAGEDVVAGDLVLAAGTLLGPAHVAAAAAVNAGLLPVHRRPRVVVLSTGSELVPAGTPLRHGQVPDSNSVLLAAAASAAGAEVTRVPAVADDVTGLGEALREQTRGADLVVTSGGVSAGAYDVVKELLLGWGGVAFGPVAMQPGKPQGAGRLPDGTPVLCLPGNPVSAHVSFEVFGRPAVRRLRGLTAVHRGEVDAVADDDWRTPSGRAQYMPVALRTVGGVVLARRAVRGGSGSHLVAGLAASDGLAVVPVDVDAVRAGDSLRILRTDT